MLGRPASTVRGWLRAFAARAGLVRRAFTALAAGLVGRSADARPGRVAARAIAVAAVAAAAAAAAGGSGGCGGALAAGCRGHLRAAAGPSWPAGLINTSWPWAAGV